MYRDVPESKKLLSKSFKRSLWVVLKLRMTHDTIIKKKHHREPVMYTVVFRLL